MLITNCIRAAFLLAFLHVSHSGAQIESCRNTPLPTPLGYKCYELVHAEVKNGTSVALSTQDAKWVVLDTEWIEQFKYGDASYNPEKIVSNAVIDIKQSWESAYKQISNSSSRLKFPDPYTGQMKEYSLDNASLRDFQTKYNYQNNISTNVGYVKVVLIANEKQECFFGICNHITAAIGGDLKVYRMYVGEPQDAKLALEKALRSVEHPYYLKIDNRCDKSLDVIVKLMSNDRSIVAGMYNFSTESARLTRANMSTALTVDKSIQVFIYARSTDGTLTWGGNSKLPFADKTYNFRKIEYGDLTISDTDATLRLTCSA